MTAEWAMVVVGVVGLLAAGSAFLWRSGEWSAGMKALQQTITDLRDSIEHLTGATNQNSNDIARLTGRLDERNGNTIDRN
jgi:hypothetical protein